jgi:hypothetical protein
LVLFGDEIGKVIDEVSTTSFRCSGRKIIPTEVMILVQ